MNPEKEKSNLIQNNFAREVLISNGKIPPNAVDFEKLVVGTCLIDKRGLEKTLEILGDTFHVFYDPRNLEIYKAIFSISKRNEPVDLLTVIHELKRTQRLNFAGNEVYLIDLTTSVSSSAHIEYHLRVLQEKYTQRALINISAQIIEDSYKESTDTFELLDKFSNAHSEIFNFLTKNQPLKSAYDLHKEYIDELHNGKPHGVPIPFASMNREFFGWQKSDLIIVAARPGMGKTAYAGTLALYAARKGFPVLVFSLEMSGIQIMKRLIANVLNIEGDKIRKHELSKNEMAIITQSDEFQNLPLYFEEKGFLTIDEIINRARILKREKQIEMLVIDYLQLIDVKEKKTLYEKISTITPKLKQLAKELNIPIICLSQLSREVEKRADKRPQLSDLRESGTIEQDADIVQFIYRPEYYGITEWQWQWHGEMNLPTENEAEIITAKRRNGETCSMRLKWNADYQRFSDLSDDYAEVRLPINNIETENDDETSF